MSSYCHQPMDRNCNNTVLFGFSKHKIPKSLVPFYFNLVPNLKDHSLMISEAK